MRVHAIHTDPIVANQGSIATVLDTYVHTVTEGSIVAITSKIISLCEGRVVPVEGTDKNRLIEQEADYFLPPETNKYGFYITIKNNTIIANAGIDESNGNGYYILWPGDPQASANAIREYFIKRFQLKAVGVLIVDSHVRALRWGTVGTALAHSGFLALRNYIGTPDIFGRKLKVTYASVYEALAGASVVVMGEGNEQTPIALITDVPFVEFVDHHPTQEELDKLSITVEEDVFAPFLLSANWQKGKK